MLCAGQLEQGPCWRHSFGTAAPVGTDYPDIFTKTVDPTGEATGAVEWVSTGSDLVRPSSWANANQGRWSPDGTTVAFTEQLGSTGGRTLYVKTLQPGSPSTGPLERVGSSDSAGAVFASSTSLVFFTSARSIVPGAPSGSSWVSGVVVRELDGAGTGAVRVVSSSAEGLVGDARCDDRISVSTDGTRVAFLARGDNLVPGVTLRANWNAYVKTLV